MPPPAVVTLFLFTVQLSEQIDYGGGSSARSIMAPSIEEAWKLWCAALKNDNNGLQGANPDQLRQQAENYILLDEWSGGYHITLKKEDGVVGKPFVCNGG